MNGIILAGGAGTRLFPMTRVLSKQLLPVYDKPMIYYPLSVLMLAGIRNILLISTREDTPRFNELLGDGTQLGLSLSYAVQPSPAGLPQAFIIGEEFIGDQPCALILGDNIFYGTDLQPKLRKAVAAAHDGATIFAYAVRDPERYGVVELDERERPITVEEKPSRPKSRNAITGLYFFDAEVVALAKSLQPSARGELEITDIIKAYLADRRLNVELLGRGTAWLDTGTQHALLAASNFVETLEERQGFKVCCPEEIAYRMGFITASELRSIALPIADCNYGRYLLDLVEDRHEWGSA